MLRTALTRLSPTCQGVHKRLVIFRPQVALYHATPCDRKRVAVIGAGPSGLVTTRHLAAAQDNFEVTCFERTGLIGGEWNYTDKTEMENGFRQTGLYPSLR